MILVRSPGNRVSVVVKTRLHGGLVIIELSAQHFFHVHTREVHSVYIIR